MATQTDRTNLNAVALNAAGTEMLEYRLKPSGARANFAWVDDGGRRILTHLNFPANSDELVWQLQTSLDGTGKVVLKVPKNPDYSRTVDQGTGMSYGMTLLYVTSPAYTLTVKRLNNAGAAPQTVTDIDFKMEAQSDVTAQTLGVNV